MFKKVLFTVLLFCPSVVWGQLLSVTATLTDSDSVVWANGTCSVQVYSPNGTPFFGATPVPTNPQACAIDGSGVLATSIYNTTTITPSGAQYRFNISSATSAPGSSFLTLVTAANMTSVLSAQLVAPRFSAAIAFVYGYADVEAVATSPGGQYYKTTSTAGQRIWSGSAWTSGGGGGGGCTASGPFGTIQASNGSGGCQSSGIIDFVNHITTGEAFEVGTPFATPIGIAPYLAISGGSTGVQGVFIQEDLGGGTDAKIWDSLILSGTLHFRVANDAYSSAADWLIVTRTGATVNTIAMPSIHSTTGTRFLCVSTTGIITASASACSGT